MEEFLSDFSLDSLKLLNIFRTKNIFEKWGKEAVHKVVCPASFLPYVLQF